MVQSWNAPDSSDCQAQVIGEGANLAVTYDARLDLGIKKTALNSDAIDNSAGVNMSDYEVNLKILLQSLLLSSLHPLFLLMMGTLEYSVQTG